MKYNAAQLKAIEEGKPMEVVMALADPAEGQTTAGTETTTTTQEGGEQDKNAELLAKVETLETQASALTAQLAELQATNEGLVASVAAAEAAAKAAEETSKALRGRVEEQTKQYAIALNQSVDATSLDAAALAAKHAELSDAVKKHFRPGGAAMSTNSPNKTEPKTPTPQEQKMLAAARSFTVGA